MLVREALALCGDDVYRVGRGKGKGTGIFPFPIMALSIIAPGTRSTAKPPARKG